MIFKEFVSRSYVAQSPSSQCEETINLFLEEVTGDKSKGNGYTFYRSPGLKLGIDLGGSSVRGLFGLNRLQGISANDGTWGISGGTATLFDTSFNVVTQISGIPDDGATVGLAASLTAFAINTSGEVYWIDGAGLHGPITWWGPGIQIGDVAVINEFFLFLDIGSYVSGFFFSEPGDINNGTALNFIPAEASANKYVKMLVDRQDIWLFGSLISQVFYDNSGNDPNNPFAPNLSAVIPHGIAAKRSAISVNGRVCWLGKSKSSVGVAFTTDGGYVARRISNHAVEYQWSTYPRIDDAISWNLTIKGHPIWRIWFPSGDVTWEYDFAVDDWRKVLSWDENTAQYHAHLGQVACAAGNQILVGARNSGKIYTTSLDHKDDAGARIRWLRRTPILTNENKRVSYPWFELDMQGGVGDGSDAGPPTTLQARWEVEIVDLGISSDNTTAITFKRTLFRWVQADYPGGSTFHIDIVAQNLNVATQTVQIVDSSDNVVASFTIPPGTVNTTLFENVGAWNPSAADDQYRIKLPQTTGVGDIVIDTLRIVADVNASSAPVIIPLTAAQGHTAIDQNFAAGDFFRTTSTVFVGPDTWFWKYNASEWATIASVRFSAVFTSAVVDASDWGECCLYDRTAASVVVTLDNKATIDTTPQYKDITVPLTSLIDGHVYDTRIRRVGPTVFNTYLHKTRLQLNLNPLTKALIPLRVGKGADPNLARFKMPAANLYTGGAISSRFIESMGTTDPGQPNQGSYIADGALNDSDSTFANITASFLNYTSSLPAAPYRSGDLSSLLINGDRYGAQVTAIIVYQAQMLLYLTVVMAPGTGISSPEADPKVMIRWSNDWARTWSNEYQRSMGKLGEYTKRVIKRGCGIARQRVFEVSGSASVPTVINGCYLRDPGVRKT